MCLAYLKLAHLSGLQIITSHVAGDLEQRHRKFEYTTQSLVLRWFEVASILWKSDYIQSKEIFNFLPCFQEMMRPWVLAAASRWSSWYFFVQQSLVLLTLTGKLIMWALTSIWFHAFYTGSRDSRPVLAAFRQCSKVDCSLTAKVWSNASVALVKSSSWATPCSVFASRVKTTWLPFPLVENLV